MQCLTKWLNSLVKSCLWLSIYVSFYTANAQAISLEQAWKRAESQYPLTRQKQFIKQTADLTIDNIKKGYWPQVNINGQASYQSDVTAVNISIPGVKIESPDKDQYKLVTDVSQVIYDGGVLRQQQAIQHINSNIEEARIDVELHSLRERITQLYLGILLLQEQIKQADIVRSDLEVGLRTVEAQVNNQLLLRSNQALMKAEVLRSEQRLIELRSARKGVIDVLGLFLRQELPEQTVFEIPVPLTAIADQVKRPELDLFKGQSYLWQQQKKLIDARIKPRTAAFVQGGYGRPALNMLKNEFEPYYIVGLRVNWSLSGFYTLRKEKRLLDVNQKTVDIQKELFLLNTNAQLKQQSAEIDKWKQLIATDLDIISLRVSVKEAAKAQLENRVITPNDYLREVNAEDAARQNLTLHQMQLLQAQFNYQNILGIH